MVEICPPLTDRFRKRMKRQADRQVGKRMKRQADRQVGKRMKRQADGQVWEEDEKAS